ncbi:MAG: tRNA pseudouridine(55) synthase TruB [Firmicutes bacterium]|nr:tRNA pseudouridine(55) synthase TruB [Bacillota bacterium]
MPRKPEPPPFDGALVLHKPAGKTSHDVVEAVRRLLGFRRMGHLGTLDPLATGVLPLLLGRATRLAQFYAGRHKRYECTIRFGFATDTYDADGQPVGPDLQPTLDRQQIEALAARFVGRISQVPPAFSAKKIRGRPAHELARKKRPVALKPIEVEVYEFRVLDVQGCRVRVAIQCAAGTYIRSLAHELGQLQGSGAHLAEIVRTAVGEFTLDQAIPLEELAHYARSGRLTEVVIPLEHLLPELPRITVLPIIERRIRHGTRFDVLPAQIQPGQDLAALGVPAPLAASVPRPNRLRVFNQQGRLIAIAQAIVPRTYQPIVVLNAAP